MRNTVPGIFLLLREHPSNWYYRLGWICSAKLGRAAPPYILLKNIKSSPRLLFINLSNSIDALPYLDDIVKHLILLYAPSKTARYE
jgi:hypothetical protein